MAENNNLNIIVQGEFSDGYALAMAQNGECLVISENNEIQKAKSLDYKLFRGIYQYSINNAKLSKFYKGVATVEITENITNPKSFRDDEFITEKIYLTRSGFILNRQSYNIANPKEPEDIITLAQRVYDEPEIFLKLKKTDLIDKKTAKALLDVAMHSIEAEIMERKKQVKAGELSEIDYELESENVLPFANKAYKHLKKMIKKLEKGSSGPVSG